MTRHDDEKPEKTEKTDSNDSLYTPGTAKHNARARRLAKTSRKLTSKMEQLKRDNEEADNFVEDLFWSKFLGESD